MSRSAKIRKQYGLATPTTTLKIKLEGKGRPGRWSDDGMEYTPTKKELLAQMRAQERPIAELVYHDRKKGLRYVYVVMKGERGEGGEAVGVGSSLALAKFIANEKLEIKMSAWKRERNSWVHQMNRIDVVHIDKVPFL